jgi:hypothetical protein
MNLKFKIVFFNVMVFLIIFDLMYLLVWVFSIQMNPIKAIIVASLAVLFTPWARPSNLSSGRKVVIRSYVWLLYQKYHKQKENRNSE